jgi:histidine kinase
MLQKIPYIRQSLTLQLILWVGLILLGSISIWAYMNIKYHERTASRHTIDEADRLGNTIRLGAHYAMMLNSRDDINQITNNIGRQPEIRNIRIFNKAGEIKFSSVREEVGKTTDIRAEACVICHRDSPPLEVVSLPERIRVLDSSEHGRLLGIISPIYNEPGCAESSCHYHPAGKVVLGALDVVVSLEKMDLEILAHEKRMIALAILIFLAIATIISVFFYNFVNRPIQKLIAATRLIGQGRYDHTIDWAREDEIGQLALAVQQMGRQIADKEEELNKQRDQYQNLFEQVPCYITVQDRDYRILTYNQETARQFNPHPGEYCYRTYKGREERCEVCPVAQTLEDGACHTGEEVVINRDGTETHWFVCTSPVRQTSDEITAVMEISLDITESKRLEKEIRKSEKKYQSIFNNIPNAVFVVDADSTEILDCNESASAHYGYDRNELVGQTFLRFFDEAERASYQKRLKSANVLSQVRQFANSGQIFVNIHTSPSEYLGRDALLVVASDITQRLIAEQQLIQASKMATLGEMSAGVAHELNQPLSVIKTASNFLLKKVRKSEPIAADILRTMAEEMDHYVDRAAKIINHLREFGRKADVTKEPVQVNESLSKAHEMFDQQLKLREIQVIKELQEDLPPVLADSNRLEQVFINLLINARDAIEEKDERAGSKVELKEIRLRSCFENGVVRIEIEDSGVGIPRLVKDKIFEPFFTTKKVGQGTGLGLSISYGIVQDYGGSIEVKSGVRQGAKFVLEFPAVRDG